MRILPIAALVGLLGCSGSSTGSDAPHKPTELPGPVVGSGQGQCAVRVGTYLATFVERSGTCGAVSEHIINADPPMMDAGTDAGTESCTGTLTMTPDRCEIDYSRVCPQDNVQKGGHISITGKSEWDLAGDYGVAVEQWIPTGAAGQVLCTSTYNITYRKL